MRGGSPSEQFGPYLVYEQLGVGGMASVHRAEVKGIEDFRRPVALKRMLPHVAGNEDLVKSFVREARLASHLRHANVAQTYDLGRVGEIYFIAMELIVGRDLRQILRRSARVGPIPVAVTLNILNQVCDALDYAHNLCDETGQRLGIVHRDVSPSNILLSESGLVKLIDFGIAKASAAGMQTMSGVLKGKFGYMAPEYIRGSIDARADLFAVGVVAYELLTSRPLFSGGDDLDTLNKVQDMPIDPPSTQNPAVPPEVDEIVMTALARDPERRWQQAAALRNAMTTVATRRGLAMLNSQVVEWADWLFDQGANPDDDSDPSISISISTNVEPQTKQIKSPSAVRLVPKATESPGFAGARSDAQRRGESIAELRTPHSLPLGTPPRMTAQRSVQPPEGTPPVRRPEEAIPTLQMMVSEDSRPTLRPTDDVPATLRLTKQRMGLRTSGLRDAEPLPPTVRTSGLRSAERSGADAGSLGSVTRGLPDDATTGLGVADDATTGLRHLAVGRPRTSAAVDRPPVDSRARASPSAPHADSAAYAELAVRVGPTGGVPAVPSQAVTAPVARSAPSRAMMAPAPPPMSAPSRRTLPRAPAGSLPPAPRDAALGGAPAPAPRDGALGGAPAPAPRDGALGGAPAPARVAPRPVVEIPPPPKHAPVPAPAARKRRFPWIAILVLLAAVAAAAVVYFVLPLVA